MARDFMLILFEERWSSSGEGGVVSGPGKSRRTWLFDSSAGGAGGVVGEVGAATGAGPDQGFVLWLRFAWKGEAEDGEEETDDSEGPGEDVS